MTITREEMAFEIGYSNYIDMEHGNDSETIDYRSLISILTRLSNDIEETRINQTNLALSITNLLNRIETVENNKQWCHPESGLAK